MFHFSDEMHEKISHLSTFLKSFNGKLIQFIMIQSVFAIVISLYQALRIACLIGKHFYSFPKPTYSANTKKCLYYKNTSKGKLQAELKHFPTCAFIKPSANQTSKKAMLGDMFPICSECVKLYQNTNYYFV